MATILELPKLIDISLAGPDGSGGIINFNLLHTILHVICRTIKIDSYRIEINDPNKSVQESIKLMGGTSPVTIQEYDATESSGKIEKGNLIEPECRDIKKIIVVKRKVTDDFPKQPISVVSGDDFRKLSQRVDSIHDVVGKVLPDNEKLIGSGTDSSALGNMWNMLNITKRVDATEIGIVKLTSMMADLTREYNNLKGSGKDRLVELEGHSPDESTLSVEVESEKLMECGSTTLCAANPSNTNTTENYPKLTPRISRFDHPVHIQIDPAIETSAEKYNHAMAEIARIKLDIDELKKFPCGPPTTDISIRNSNRFGGGIPIPSSSRGGESICGMRIADEHRSPLTGAANKKIEFKIMALDKKINAQEERITSVVENLQEVSQLTTNINMGSYDPDGNYLPGISDIYDELKSIKNEGLRTIDRVKDQKVTIETLINSIGVLNGRVEELNIAKADREEVDELLSEKADYVIVQRKVSVDQFESVNEDLASMIGRARTTIKGHEENLNRANKLIDTVVDGKLDKDELNSVKDSLNRKIQALSDRLQKMLDSQAAETAGTRIKFLRDVECMACNQNVIMRMEKLETVPKMDYLPPKRSVKPFLTYELDTVRQQLRMKPAERNMNSFEIIDKVGKIIETEEQRGKHLSSRFCGGSHTRVDVSGAIHVKNLQKIKTGDVSNQNEGVVKGTDGGLYKAASKEKTTDTK